MIFELKNNSLCVPVEHNCTQWERNPFWDLIHVFRLISAHFVAIHTTILDLMGIVLSIHYHYSMRANDSEYACLSHLNKTTTQSFVLIWLTKLKDGHI